MMTDFYIGGGAHQGRKMHEPIRDAYLCDDGWFEVRDDESPYRWIATKHPVEVRR